MLEKVYQVISTTDPAHPYVGVASSVIYRNLEGAWNFLETSLNDIFRDYRLGSISKIHSVEINIEDRIVVIQYEYRNIKDRIIKKSLMISEAYLLD